MFSCRAGSTTVRPPCTLQVAKERRKWKPFGAAAKETPQDSVTVQVRVCVCVRVQGPSGKGCRQPAALHAAHGLPPSWLCHAHVRLLHSHVTHSSSVTRMSGCCTHMLHTHQVSHANPLGWQAVEDIPFDRVRQLKATQQEKKQANMDLQTAMQQGMDKQAISGRCGTRAVSMLHCPKPSAGLSWPVHVLHGQQCLLLPLSLPPLCSEQVYTCCMHVVPHDAASRTCCTKRGWKESLCVRRACSRKQRSHPEKR